MVKVPSRMSALGAAYAAWRLAHPYWRNVLFIAVGCIPFGLAIAIASYTDRLTADHCTLVSIFDQDKHTPDGLLCRKLVMSADLPSVILGVTSTLAMGLHLIIREQKRGLLAKLLERGVVLDSAVSYQRKRKLTRYINRPWTLHSYDPVATLGHPIKARTITFVGVVFGLVAIGLYVQAKDHDFAMQLIADHVSRKDHSGTQGIAETWWARFDQGHLWSVPSALPVLWTGIGFMGVWVGFIDLLSLARIFDAIRELDKKERLRYVPGWAEDENGWVELGNLAACQLIGLMVFAAAGVGAALILYGTSSGNVTGPAFLIVGGVVQMQALAGCLRISKLRVKTVNSWIRVTIGRLDRERPPSNTGTMLLHTKVVLAGAEARLNRPRALSALAGVVVALSTVFGFAAAVQQIAESLP